MLHRARQRRSRFKRRPCCHRGGQSVRCHRALGNGSAGEVPCSRRNGRSGRAGFPEVEFDGPDGYLNVFRLGPSPPRYTVEDYLCDGASGGGPCKYPRGYDHDLDCDVGIKRYLQGHGRSRIGSPVETIRPCQRAFFRYGEWLSAGRDEAQGYLLIS